MSKLTELLDRWGEEGDAVSITAVRSALEEDLQTPPSALADYLVAVVANYFARRWPEEFGGVHGA